MYDNSVVELAVQGQWSFRVTGIFDQSAPGTPLDSPMIDVTNAPNAAFKQTSSGSYVGISTQFGSVLIDPNDGAFQMLDANQNVITRSAQLISYTPSVQETSAMFAQVDSQNDTCAAVYPATDANGGHRMLA
jgi:hypothetical protein